jgi:hypothetical protein
LGITISHFASSPDPVGAALVGFKTWCDFVVTTSNVCATGSTGLGAIGGTATGLFVVTTSMVGAIGSTGLGAAAGTTTGLADLGIACGDAVFGEAGARVMYDQVTGKRNVAP